MSSTSNSFEYANAAYIILQLAVNCYIEIQNRGNLISGESNDFVELAQKNLEEGFDAMTLLPDASSLCKRYTADTDKENDIVVLLLNLESFVSKFDDGSENTSPKRIKSNNALARFFPCLARVSYKVRHDIQFVQKGI